jgi:hypothetical protein
MTRDKPGGFVLCLCRAVIISSAFNVVYAYTCQLFLAIIEGADDSYVSPAPVPYVVLQDFEKCGDDRAGEDHFNKSL